EWVNTLDRFGNIFHGKSARENKPAGIEPVDPVPGKCGARTAVSSRPGVKQIKIGGENTERPKGRLFFLTKRFDDFPVPTGAIFGAFFAVKLPPSIGLGPAIKPGEAKYIRHLLSCRINEHRHIEGVRRQSFNNLSGPFRLEKSRARRVKIET